MSEQDFWKRDATLDDIAGKPPVNLKKCLDAIIPEIEPAIKGVENPVIFEIGSGTGRLTIPIQKHFKNANVIGIDISQKFLTMAYEKSKNMKEPPLFYRGNKIFKKCDAVYTMLVFQHLPSIQVYSYMLDVQQYLKVGGIFRFQYVEGNIDHNNNHQISAFTMNRWLKECKLEVVKEEKGLIYPEWNWITAVKK